MRVGLCYKFSLVFLFVILCILVIFFKVLFVFIDFFLENKFKIYIIKRSSFN